MIRFSLNLNIILIFEHDYKIIASIISLYEVQKDKKNQEEYNNKSCLSNSLYHVRKVRMKARDVRAAL